MRRFKCPTCGHALTEREALKQADNIADMAEILGLSTATVYRRLLALGMSKPRGRRQINLVKGSDELNRDSRRR